MESKKLRFTAWSKSEFEPVDHAFMGEESIPEVAVAKALAKVNELSLANIRKNGMRLSENDEWIQRYSCTIARHKRGFGFVDPITIEFEFID